MEEIESCGEQCANLCRVYKLIMVSRVPSYGHLEYVVLGLSCESHHVTLINIVGFLMMMLIGIEIAVNHSQSLTTTMIVNKIYSFVAGKNWLYAEL